MNLACASEVFQDLQGSGHCEIIYTGVRAHTHARAHAHTSPPPVPRGPVTHSQLQVFQSRLGLKLAGTFIVQGEEGFLHLLSRLQGNAIFSFFFSPPLLDCSTHLQKLPSSAFFFFFSPLSLFPHKWPLDQAQPLGTARSKQLDVGA